MEQPKKCKKERFDETESWQFLTALECSTVGPYKSVSMYCISVTPILMIDALVEGQVKQKGEPLISIINITH